MVSADSQSRRYVQYGCGLCAPSGWDNFDASPRLRFERLPGVGAIAALAGRRLFPANVAFGDIRYGLPVANGSVDGIYASHVLEHLSRNDVEVALVNTWQLLRSGGVFRLVVPDLAARAERYVQKRSARNAKSADDFLAELNVGEMDRPQGPAALMRATFGHSGNLWMYDEDLMGYLLLKAGFTDIRRCAFHDSGDAMFDAVEDEGRFSDQGVPELAMQAKKP